MINNEDPSFVNLPNPSIAKGHMPAQINELGKPSKTTNQIEISVEWPRKLTWLCAKIINSENIVPSNVQTRSAFT